MTAMLHRNNLGRAGFELRGLRRAVSLYFACILQRRCGAAKRSGTFEPTALGADDKLPLTRFVRRGRRSDADPANESDLSREGRGGARRRVFPVL